MCIRCAGLHCFWAGSKPWFDWLGWFGLGRLNIILVIARTVYVVIVGHVRSACCSLSLLIGAWSEPRACRIFHFGCSNLTDTICIDATRLWSSVIVVKGHIGGYRIGWRWTSCRMTKYGRVVKSREE